MQDKEITDTERLDFLIAEELRVNKIGRFYTCWFDGKNNIGDTPREAIDAAIKSQKEQKQ